ncbi:SdpI family protein [Bacillus sp. AK031]
MNIVLGLILIGCALLFTGLSLPLYLKKVKMNYLYGVRFPNSFQSDEAWYEINRYGGKQLIIWSVPMLIAGVVILFLPSLDESAAAMVSFLPVVFLIPPLIKSYIYSLRIKR